MEATAEGMTAGAFVVEVAAEDVVAAEDAVAAVDAVAAIAAALVFIASEAVSLRWNGIEFFAISNGEGVLCLEVCPTNENGSITTSTATARIFNLYVVILSSPSKEPGGDHAASC
jgi:hypothetical protein